MIAYNKYEVDNVFSGWKEDLKQLSEIEVVSVDVLDKIRVEIEQKLKEPMYQHEGEDWMVGLIMAQDIIDRYREGE